MRRSANNGMASQGRIAIHGLGAPVEVRRHPGARRLTLRVSQARRSVILTVPPRCRLDEASLFVDRNIDWVRQQLGDLPRPEPIVDGMAMPLRGCVHRIVFAGPHRAGAVVRAMHDTEGLPELIVSGRREHAPRRLKDWLVERAREDLDHRVTWHARNIGVRAKRICVRDQTSRWGSCSTTGVLSFSWRLILAPPMVLDYVAAHEVAHLAEMNHGPRFWRLVMQTMPDMEEAKRWLRKFGMELHRYGAGAAA